MITLIIAWFILFALGTCIAVVLLIAPGLPLSARIVFLALVLAYLMALTITAFPGRKIK